MESVTGTIFSSTTNVDQYGVWTLPMGTKVAWLKDPDGNTITLSQPN
ncbi:MAG: hypothetical protein H7061_03735 [Bdellovibrionaceae bacterium]|nr:hypothetical protein [Bdellovibrio sp.]